MLLSCRQDPIATLEAWWEEQRGARPMPRRSELDPGALRHILPDLMLIDVADDEQFGKDFTARLIGTRIDSHLGQRFTGRSTEPALGSNVAGAVRAQYQAVIDRQRPIRSQNQLVLGDRYLDYDRLIMPLSNEDGTEIIALVAAVEFACTYALEIGRPMNCPGAQCCAQQDQCVQKANRPRPDPTAQMPLFGLDQRRHLPRRAQDVAALDRCVEEPA